MTMDGDFREDHVLADGARVTLRFIRADDAPLLREGFARLSPVSRYERFLVGMSELSDSMVRYLTEVDGRDHVAIVATTDSHDLKSEVGLGVARFIRLPDEPTVAEAAVTVIDDAQGRGIGRLLLAALTNAALERGVRVFRAEVLATNAPMRRILDEVGAVVRADEGATLVYDVPLTWRPLPGHDDVDAPADAAAHRDHPLRRLLRAAAESIANLRFFGDDAPGDAPDQPPRAAR